MHLVRVRNRIKSHKSNLPERVLGIIAGSVVEIINVMWTYLQGFLGCLSLILGTVGVNALPSNVESRIINGTEVTWNNTRYQVSVRLEAIDSIYFGSGHMCGGSLVAPNVVLTASHCIWNDNQHKFRSANEFTVVMGNLDRTVKYGNTLKIPVREIIMKSTVNPSTFRDDIAIMILNQSVPENYTGSSIIEMNEVLNLPEGTKCSVSGWGITEKSTYARKLMSVDVPIIGRAFCARNYGTQTILDGMLCAGYMAGERDACSGDSGGPLVCNNKLVGIVSFGIGCALSGYPGVYVDVAYYVDWIRNQTGLMKKQGLDIDSVNGYFNYTIETYAKNSTGSTNSTGSSNVSPSIVDTRHFIWILLPLVGFLFNFL